MVDKNRQTGHDRDVCRVEYSGMERPNADDDDVCDKTLSGNSVNEIARSARPNQRKTNETVAARASAD
jgi:hypothetical protein